MVRVIGGKRFYWLMSYIEKSEAMEKARQHRKKGAKALARVIKTRKGFYEVWAI